MSDEANEDEAVEGVLIAAEQGPLSDVGEAQALMSQAWDALRLGAEALTQGRELLARAEHRQAWKILGFGSWEECMTAGISENLRTSLRPEARAELALQFRTQQGLSTRVIADALGVNHSTIARDLVAARAQGRLTPEQDRVVASDGKLRQGNRDGVDPQRRRNFKRSWTAAVDDLGRRSRTIQDLRDDDRFAKHVENIWSTKSDLERAVDILLDALADLERRTPAEYRPPEGGS